MNVVFDMSKVICSSSWSGDEVGYDHLPLVNLYIYQPESGPEINFYVDEESGEILDMWSCCECQE